MRCAPIVVAVTCVLGARVARAYRPFDGTDGDVAETGEIELELGPLQGAHTDGETKYEPGFVFNYGFAASYELVVDADGEPQFGTPNGQTLLISDVLVKHLLRAGSLENADGPSVAIETGVLLPNLPASGVDEAGWSLALIVSQRWKPLTVHLNFEALYQRDRTLAGNASAIVEGPIAWRVRPVTELLIERAGDAGQLASVLGGAIWRLRSNLRKSSRCHVVTTTLQT